MIAVPRDMGPVRAGRARQSQRRGQQAPKAQTPQGAVGAPMAERGTHRRASGMEIKGGTESRVEGALLLGDGEGDRRGKGLRKLHQSRKSTLLERAPS